MHFNRGSSGGRKPHCTSPIARGARLPDPVSLSAVPRLVKLKMSFPGDLAVLDVTPLSLADLAVDLDALRDKLSAVVYAISEGTLSETLAVPPGQLLQYA